MVTESKSICLALDSGSQSSRAILFDAQGGVLGLGSHVHQPMLYPVADAVEQDPTDIKDCLFQAIRDCLKEWGGDPGDIAGAALTTQRTAVMATDAEGTPLTDIVSWLDRRSASIDSEPSMALRTVLKALGSNAIVPRLLGKAWPRMWRENQPELLPKIERVNAIESWLHHQLVGRMAFAPGGVVGTWPFDVKQRQWSRSSLMLKALGFKRRWLPEIVEAGREIGRLTRSAAEQTGLPEGLPFFAVGGDKQAEALGAGVRVGSKNVAAVSLGTGSSISIPWPRPVSSRRFDWLTMASAEPASWHIEYMVFRGMWTVRWFADQFARDLAPVAAESGRPVEALLCDEAKEIPPGSDGVVVWPRWSPSLQFPEEVGTCIGLRETHSRGHFFRALLEGLAFDLKRGLTILEDALNTHVTEIRVGGGGSRSSVVVQILADVLELPVVRPEFQELAARGAAIVAAAGAGVHPSIAAAVDAMVPEAPVVAYDGATATHYRKIYRDVYLPGFKNLRAIARNL